VIIDEEQARKQSLFFRFEKTSAVLYFRFLNVLRAKYLLSWRKKELDSRDPRAKWGIVYVLIQNTRKSSKIAKIDMRSENFFFGPCHGFRLKYIFPNLKLMGIKNL
jgi:hypothetical protein